jgi:hypothetical protein
MKRTILTAVSLLILFVLPPHLSAGPQSWQQAQKIAERIGCWAKNSVAPMTPGNVFLKMGDKETVVPLKLTNWGDTEVTSISYTFYYTDKQVSEGPFVLHLDQPLKDGETREVKIPIKPGQKLGKEELLFNITQVNGQYNEASAGYAYLTCCTVNKMPHKRVLVEDYAGMWCWHCPIGLVATDAIARMYPDDVVAVSVHKTDDISKVVSRGVHTRYGIGSHQTDRTVPAPHSRIIFYQYPLVRHLVDRAAGKIGISRRSLVILSVHLCDIEEQLFLSQFLARFDRNFYLSRFSILERLV